MFLIDLWYSALASLGLYHKNVKILFLGLDNAGKTTLLHMLKENRVPEVHVPTLHPNMEELIIGNIKFKTFELGPHETAQRLLQDYVTTVDGVVYLVDAMDRGRFPEAKNDLDALLTSDKLLCNVPFLVFGTKSTCPRRPRRRNSSTPLDSSILMGRVPSRIRIRECALLKCTCARSYEGWDIRTDSNGFPNSCPSHFI